MRKIAIIIIGGHYAGKSKTINEYLKRKLSLDEEKHKFNVGNCRGFILSQTLEERNADVESLARYKDYDILVLPTRPENETNSLFKAVKQKLKKFDFEIVVYKIEKNQEENYYQDKASEINNQIQSYCKNDS